MNWRERLKGDALAILVWSVATCYNCKGKPLYGHIAPTVERRTCNAEAASANLAVSMSLNGEIVSRQIVNLEYRVHSPVEAYAGVAQSGRAAPC